MDDRNRSIPADVLYARLGSEAAPIIVDVRPDADFVGAESLVTAAFHRSPDAVEQWRMELPSGRQVVTYCIHGREVSQGVAAALRLMGVEANFLEGGLANWIEQGLPTRRNIGASPSRWVTRERPKIDRIACPWLVRRFIDPTAEFFYVPKDEVRSFAAANDATPYDIPDAAYGHAGSECSFDAFIRRHEIADAALAQLASIVRGADTATLALAEQAAGLLAVSRGLSRLVAG